MTTTTTMTMTKTTPSSTITKIPDRFFLRCTRATEDSLAIRFARCTLHRNCCESTEEGKCYCESEIDIKIYRKWEWKKNRAAARKWEKFHGNDGTKMWNLVSCILYKCGFSSAHFSYTLFETFISRRAITSFMAYSGRKTKFRIVCFFSPRVCQMLLYPVAHLATADATTSAYTIAVVIVIVQTILGFSTIQSCSNANELRFGYLLLLRRLMKLLMPGKAHNKTTTTDSVVDATIDGCFSPSLSSSSYYNLLCWSPALSWRCLLPTKMLAFYPTLCRSFNKSIYILTLALTHTHTLSQTALTWCSLSFSWFISLLLFFLQLSEATNKTHHEIWVALCAPMDALFLFSMFGRHHRRRRRQRLHLPFSCRVQIFLLTTHTQLIIYSQTLKKPAILYNTSINLHITLDNLCRFYHCN